MRFERLRPSPVKLMLDGLGFEGPAASGSVLSFGVARCDVLRASFTGPATESVGLTTWIAGSERVVLLEIDRTIVPIQDVVLAVFKKLKFDPPGFFKRAVYSRAPGLFALYGQVSRTDFSKCCIGRISSGYFLMSASRSALRVVCFRTDSWINSWVSGSFGCVGKARWIVAAMEKMPVEELLECKQASTVDGIGKHLLVRLLCPVRSNRFHTVVQV